MYLQFFGLTEVPFSITPDPAFVYLSAAHRDALAHLLYGVGKGGAGGFVQLTGEVGTGKTTLCRCLLQQVPEDTIIALILNPMLTPRELLVAICEELDVNIDGIRESSKELVDALNACLLHHHAHDRRVVVVIDEAQNLSPDALEQVRLLTNLETAKHKLLQMVLLGQPELRQLLQRQNLRQLAQRITARYHLTPLSEKETVAYVRHRMQVAGAQHNPFNRSAMRALYQRSSGIPRLINIIADRALAGAYAFETSKVNARLVHAAASEVQPSETRMQGNRRPGLIAVAAVMLLLVVFLSLWTLPGMNLKIQAPNGSGDAANQASSDADTAKPAATLPIQNLGSGETVPAQQTLEPVVPDQELAGNPVTDKVKLAVGEDTTNAVTPSAAPPLVFASPTAIPAGLDARWLAEQSVLSWQGLADVWRDGKRVNALRAACDGQPGTGYACLHIQGNWGKIQRLGLPVILVLQDDLEYRLMLTGMDEDRLLVGIGAERRLIDRKTMDNKWLGEYIVAWPQAPDWPMQVQRGEAGAAVKIVMQMAAQADPPWTGADQFDAGFESWLFDFQRRQGLIPDGIVGPQTLLYLMAPTIIEPRLAVNLDGGY